MIVVAKVRNRQVRVIGDDSAASHVRRVLDDASVPLERCAEPDDDGLPAVAVVATAPVPCAAALTAALSGQLAGVVRADRLDDLVPALVAVSHGLVVLSEAVRALAAEVPQLNERQLGVLAGVIRGQTNRTIAETSHLSEATVKRELAQIAALLGAKGRVAVAARAVELGISATTSEAMFG